MITGNGLVDSNGNLVAAGTDTLGRTLINGYYDTNGNVRTAQASTQIVNISTHLCGALNNPYDQMYCAEYTGSWNALHTVTVPDGASGLTYTINYVEYDGGQISSITLPSGATISYTWTTVASPFTGYSDQRVHTRTVSVTGQSPAQWIYDYTYTTTERSTTVTDPYGNQAKYTCTNIAPGWNDMSWEVNELPCYIGEADYYAGSVSNSNLVKKVVTSYWNNGTIMPKSVATIEYAPPGSTNPSFTSTVETDYDSISTNAGPATWGNVIDKREYSGGTLIRRTHNTYLHQGNSTYRNVNLSDLPTDVSIFDCTLSACIAGSVGAYTNNWSGGTLVAETQTSYDDTALSSSPTSAPGHDDTNYGLSNTVRGNPTTIKKCSAISANACTAWATTTNVFDILGNLRTSTDPGNSSGQRHTTTYDYTDSWSGSTGACVPAGQTYAFLTKVTNAKSQSTTWSHYCTSEVNTFRDLNNQPTSYAFDIVKRLTQATYPDGGQVNFAYSDTPNAMSVSRTVKRDGSNTIRTDAFFDGLGRTTQTKLTDSSDGDTFIDTTYDLMGRVATVSNPHRSTSAPTDGTTTYQYDALGRKILEIPPDGTSGSNNVKTAYGVQTTAPVGVTTTVTDQASHKRMTVSDGLGRLVEVMEPDPSSGSLVNATIYQYNGRDDLTCVEQHGNVAGTGCSADPSNDATSAWRIRRFNYDPLSRLLTAKNPETGTTTWTYDPDSNVLTKTDARGVVINYNPSASPIDPLHRVTQKTYSNGDATVSYFYDQTSYNGLTITNGIGHQTGMNDRTGSTAWTFDSMGRSLQERRTVSISGLTPSAVTKSLIYVYNLDGSLKSLTYPSNHRVDYTYNNAGHLLSAIDPTGSPVVNYVTSAKYAPHGEVATLTNGYNSPFLGILTTNTWNKRLQPSTFTAATQGTGGHTVLSLSFNFNLGTQDNGLLIEVNNNLNTGRNTNYKYDQLNRITAGYHDATDWGTTYGIDIWGNLTGKNPCTVALCGSTRTMNDSLTASANVKNQLNTYAYDASGNMTNDQLGHAYSYDAENRPYSAAGISYYYDGEGERVAKSSGKLYFFGTGSAPVVESDVNGNWTAEYIFFGGKRVAMRKSDNSVHYYFVDQIGSTNLMTNADASVTEQDIEYHPYGEEQVYTDSLGQEYRFTGKERDSETQLDYFGARYYASTMGRFLSPDPSNLSVFFSNPQSWNRYAYVYNNPLRLTDDNGKWPTDIHNQIIDNSFPNLTAAQRQILKNISAQQDSILMGGQGNSMSFEHAMRGPDQTVAQAQAKYEDFVSGMEDSAQKAQWTFWLKDPLENGESLSDEALARFAEALHAVLDSTSPAHAGFQKWDWRHPSLIIAHHNAEKTINPQQMLNAINAAQNAFNLTFGNFGFTAPPPKEHVTHKICYTDDKGKQVCQ